MDPIVPPPNPSTFDSEKLQPGCKCSPSKVFPSEKLKALKPRSGSQSSKLVPRGQYSPPTHTHPHKSRADPSPLRNVPSKLPPPQGAPEEEPGHRRRRGVLATLPTCCSRPAREQPRSARASEQTNERAPGCSPAPLGPPPLACLARRSPPPGDSSRRRTGQQPLSAPPSLRSCTSSRPPHLRRRRKVPASRRALAPRVRSGRTRSSSRPGPAPRTPPRPGSSSAEGVRGRGRSSPRLPHPPAPLSPPRSPLPPPAPLAAAHRPARPFASGPPHPPEPRLLPRPPVALPLNFPPRWRPWSWPGARPRDCFPDALSQ